MAAGLKAVKERDGISEGEQARRAIGAQVDFDAEEVRLEPGTTKNGEGRTFPFTDGLREMLIAQRDERDALKRQGRICPFVFQSEGDAISEGTFVKAWHKLGEPAVSPAG